MMPTLSLLSCLMLLPLLGVFVLMTIPMSWGRANQNVRYVALLTSITTFLLSLGLLSVFDLSAFHPQLMEKYTLPLTGFSYALGIDGISLSFIWLTTFLTCLVVLAGWKSITYQLRNYMAFFLLLEAIMIGVFTAQDLLLFFIFFEATLIPMFFIVGIWGGERRLYAVFKFFLYTLMGSLAMLVAVLYIYQQTGTFDLATITNHCFSQREQFWLWLGFFISFAIKIPMWPVHTWLPDTHVEAPTGGSVILAGILLKLGGYGLLRFSIPFFPDAMHHFTPFVFALSVVAIIYASYVAFVQHDIKKLVAYSSIAHMGLVTLGIFSSKFIGLQGAIFQMISHGVISGGLFLLVGMIYDRMHTREIDAFGGLAVGMPSYATYFMILTLASVGLPGTMGFVGEVMVIFSTFFVSPLYAILAVTGVVWSAMYALWLYRKMFFGAVKESLKKLHDLSLREKCILAPLTAIVLFFGLFPCVLLNITAPAAHNLLRISQKKQMNQKLETDMPMGESLKEMPSEDSDNEFSAPFLNQLNLSTTEVLRDDHESI